MTTPEIRPVEPATDEEIATWVKRPCLDTQCRCIELHMDKAIARIEADRAQIKRCHAIIQSFVAITDPDAGPHLDAAMELNGEFCPGECTHECEERAESDRARIAELEADCDVYLTLNAEANRAIAKQAEEISDLNRRIAVLESDRGKGCNPSRDPDRNDR